MEKGIEEKRTQERFDLEIPAKIELRTSGEEKEVLDLLTSNICSGGAFLHTVQPLPAGSEVKIDLILQLPELKELEDDYQQGHVYIGVTGSVLRSESTGMAVCFNEDYQIRPAKAEQLVRH